MERFRGGRAYIEGRGEGKKSNTQVGRIRQLMEAGNLKGHLETHPGETFYYEPKNEEKTKCAQTHTKI